LSPIGRAPAEPGRSSSFKIATASGQAKRGEGGMQSRSYSCSDSLRIRTVSIRCPKGIGGSRQQTLTVGSSTKHITITATSSDSSMTSFNPFADRENSSAKTVSKIALVSMASKMVASKMVASKMVASMMAASKLSFVMASKIALVLYDLLPCCFSLLSSSHSVLMSEKLGGPRSLWFA
jgi:hypothetical protein